ncbi:YcdB/YcdC domain-containing protein [Tepidibacter hydrothermalis]|uniref:S-layer homology domain-containing protein n=1 Tax=Tepidibacter hydrothermalis TaxID=3036126 RepID=A0ABY8EDC1_9FIRM|nr:S-layer homology domain-containing protein [Tepidibacter hydrothermalis]WFD09492.1 S-layer homology domain-containing protein [Tepidibacter hydrothermalis]
MKKGIAVIMSLVMMIVAFVPSISMAKENDGLEKAILKAKNKFNIGDEFKNFEYYKSNNGKTIWNLNWSTEEKLSRRISVSIDNDGYIKSYRKSDSNYKNDTNINVISKDEAKKISDEFIKFIDPKLINELKYIEEDNSTIQSDSYYFNYIRLVNEVPFYDNGVRVVVNKETKEVTDYNLNYDYNVKFKGTDKIIGLDKAKQKYIEELGLKLVYRKGYDKDSKPYLVYTNKYGSTYGIDALTGKKEKIDSNIIYYKNADLNEGSSVEKKDVGLSEEEIKAVNEVSNLISKEDADKIARESKFIKMSSEHELKSYSLNKSYLDDSKYTWYLNYISNDKKSGSVHVSIDASSGEIKTFNKYLPYDADREAKYDKDYAKKEAQKFLSEFYSDKNDSLKYDDSYDEFYDIQENSKPKYYNFKFNRVVNGIEYENNYITIGYDAVLGNINALNIVWDDIEFKKPNVIGMDKAYNILFDKIGINLEYKKNYDYKNNKEEEYAKLVYVLDNSIPHNIDATNGDIIYDDKTKYKKVENVNYKDINGHYAQKQIEKLREFGIKFDSEFFKPNEKIIQSDFLKLYMKTINSYYGEVESMDNMYAYLIREGIINEEDVNPDKIMTKKEALKVIIKGLKYEPVANIKGIFNCPFDDVAEDFKGYASIGYGLNIVSGYNGKLNPNEELTRANAAIMIYNYLNK